MNEKVFNGQTVLAESLLLDSLTIADGAVLTAPAGKCLTLTVDGVTRELEPGTYTCRWTTKTTAEWTILRWPTPS